MVDSIAADARRSLQVSGLNRALSAMDVLLAATAMAHGAFVLHYRSDFDHIAAAHPTFRARWVVPRGTV